MPYELSRSIKEKYSYGTGGSISASSERSQALGTLLI